MDMSEKTTQQTTKKSRVGGGGDVSPRENATVNVGSKQAEQKLNS